MRRKHTRFDTHQLLELTSFHKRVDAALQAFTVLIPRLARQLHFMSFSLCCIMSPNIRMTARCHSAILRDIFPPAFQHRDQLQADNIFSPLSRRQYYYIAAAPVIA